MSRRTVATVVNEMASLNLATELLGPHGLEGDDRAPYPPDRTIDHSPAAHLELTLRPDHPNGQLLDMQATAGEEEGLDELDTDDDEYAAA